MDTEGLTITEQRRDIGKQIRFTQLVGGTELVVDIASEDTPIDVLTREVSTAVLDTFPAMSTHEVNTFKRVTEDQVMAHDEGGWSAKGYQSKEAKKHHLIERGRKDEVKVRVSECAETVALCSRENSSVDIYEDYFTDLPVEHQSEPPSAKTVTVLRDVSSTPRFATKISWHPAGTKLAVAYSTLKFQDESIMSSSNMSSYIWDPTYTSTPEQELTPPSPLVCLKYYPKNPDTLVGGSYNGLLTIYDVRKGSDPVGSSQIKNSHQDPVYDFHYISTANQIASVSTDGQLLWWDFRNPNEPIDKLTLSLSEGTILGGSSMDYNIDAGSLKYLVGTEQGIVLSVNTRNKGKSSMIWSSSPEYGHHYPIVSIQRNPLLPKFYLTIGDWTARIWMDDTKRPISESQYHSSYVTGGCWSSTRAGVFYVARMDGRLDVWDYMYQQSKIAYYHKVSDTSLTSVSILTTGQGNGKFIGVGDAQGNVSILELGNSLVYTQSKEASTVAHMFDCEQKREKNLEQRSMILQQKALDERKQVPPASISEPLGAVHESSMVVEDIEAGFYESLRNWDEAAVKGRQWLGIRNEIQPTKVVEAVQKSSFWGDSGDVAEDLSESLEVEDESKE